MSNHFHIVVTDEKGTLPTFTEELNKNLAKSLNCLHTRRENLWSGGEQTNHLLLADEDAVLRETVYALANPTKAGLVAHGGEWPGVRLFLKGKYQAKKPPFFFRFETNGGALPDKLDLVITSPPIGAHEKITDALVKAAVTKEEKGLRDARYMSGKGFMGAAKIKNQEIDGSPSGPGARRAICPRVACKDVALRIQILLSYREFAEDYKAKREQFAGGDHSVMFPFGTYRMVHFYGANCALE